MTSINNTAKTPSKKFFNAKIPIKATAKVTHHGSQKTETMNKEGTQERRKTETDEVKKN